MVKGLGQVHCNAGKMLELLARLNKYIFLLKIKFVSLFDTLLYMCNI